MGNSAYTKDTWHSAYHELLNTLEKLGYPSQFGKMIASELKTELAMRRMISYLCHSRATRMEDIADEMIAIISDRDQWIKKKEAEEANARYTEWLNSDEREMDE